MAHMREPAAIRRDMLRAEDDLRLALDTLAATLPVMDKAMRDAEAALAAVTGSASALDVDRSDMLAAAEATLAEARARLAAMGGGDAPKPKAPRRSRK